MGFYANATYVRDRVTETLLNMMKVRDYQTISISDLVHEAGVSRSSFYRNFTDKEDVIRGKLIRLTQTWGTEFEYTKNQDFSDCLLQHFYENRDFYLLLFRSGLSFMVLDQIKRACGVRPETPPIFAYGAASIAGALFGWVDEWISRGMKESPQELKELAKTLKGL